ncbi:hypothetical protein RJI07_01040 [Mycoplasmatota bacterium WC30]
MKKIKYLILIILIPILIVALGFGIYFISYEWGVQRNIDNMKTENESFYDILNEEGIDVHNYVLYEEIFMENGKYYLIFTEDTTALYEEGDVIIGILLEIESDIYTEYIPSINWEIEGSNYTLPYLWIAGGGSAYLTSQAFFKRAELRRLVLENSSSITLGDITIMIDGSYCLGKLELS